VAWGNACLRGTLSPDELDRWWPRTRFVRTLGFRDGDRALGPQAWLAERQADGASRLRLDARGIVGCESVLACADAAVSAWRQRWDRIPDAKEAPWFDAVFTREAPPSELPPPSRSADEVLAELTNALQGLVTLSERADLSHWGSYFARVLAVARGELVEGDSLLPPTAAPEVHQLARAANLADVFGGMGSWNDFEPLRDPASESERERCSSLLFTSTRAALAATAEQG